MLRLATLGLGLVLAFGACNDPKDPQTWIKRLRDITEPSPALPMGARFSTKAVKELQKIGNPVAVKPLSELFKDHKSPVILRAIISFKDKQAIPTLIEALDFTEDEYHNATLAANALADFKATEAVDALVKILDRQLPVKSRANLAKLATIAALEKIGDKRAVPALIRTLERRPEQQDFLLNKRSAEALGELGDPRAVPVLIKGLFMASTIQGTSYPQARVALVRMGGPAVQPLIDTMLGKNEAVNLMSKELSFREGVVAQKTAIVLGDIALPQAVPVLLSRLAKSDMSKTKAAGLIEALGKIGDHKVIPTLLKILNNKKANYKLRMQVCQALTVIGDKRALPSLLEVAEKGYIEGGYTNLREGAAMAYGRIVGAEAAAAVPKFKAMVNDDKLKAFKETQGVFKEALDRLNVAVECKDDARCYGKKVNDTKLSLAQREKAGIMIGILPSGREALADLTKAVKVREPILRLFFLESVKHVGRAKDTELVKVLEDLVARDSRRRTKFLGADLASADKIALAIVKRK